MKAKYLVLLSLLLISLIGCKNYKNYGNHIDDKQLVHLKNIKASKEEVMKKLGSPTLIPDYNQNNWYYVSRKESARSFLSQKTEAQRIVKLSFKDDYVYKTEVLDHIANDHIAPISETTETKGTEQSYIQEFVKNMGRFNKLSNK